MEDELFVFAAIPIKGIEDICYDEGDKYRW